MLVPRLFQTFPVISEAGRKRRNTKTKAGKKVFKIVNFRLVCARERYFRENLSKFAQGSKAVHNRAQKNQGLEKSIDERLT